MEMSCAIMADFMHFSLTGRMVGKGRGSTLERDRWQICKSAKRKKKKEEKLEKTMNGKKEKD